MSFGRSVMNVCTLGLWGVLVDPDLDDVFDRHDVFAQVEAHNVSSAAQVLAAEICKQFSWIKSPLDERDYIKIFQGVASKKDGEKLVDYLKKYQERLKVSGFGVRVSFYDTGYWLPKDAKSLQSGFHAYDELTFCPKCPRLLSWRHSRIFCARKHSKTKGVHADRPSVREMRYESITLNRYGLEIYHADGIDEEEDD